MMSVRSGTGPVASGPLSDKCVASMAQKWTWILHLLLKINQARRIWYSDQDYDECVYYHEGSDLYADDVVGQTAVLPEVPVTTEDTPEENDRIRQTIWKFRHLLIGKGNALPPAVRGVECDIDVGGARPIALKCSKLRIQFKEKLAGLIKGLLSAKMVNYSRSPLSIGYRLVNCVTQLMIYPMPLINDLPEDLESTLCRSRMPFGLKNAPQIYQRMIDNTLYGFTRIPKSEDYRRTLDAFEDGGPADSGKPSALRRRSYIDDILIPANNWGQLCDRVEYLGHKISHNGLEANPKDLSELKDSAFPGLFRAMQSFLGSLNYYSRIIEYYAIFASVLYDLREIDFTLMVKETTQAQIQRVLEAANADPESQEGQVIDDQKSLDLEAQDLTGVGPRWIHAYRSFGVLKSKIAFTPILRHIDPCRSATVVVYASDGAVSGSLMQEYDKIYYRVMFASHTLKSNEPTYDIAEKGVLALLRILDLNYNALVGHPIRVVTRHFILARLFISTALQGRLGQWAALLSPWTLETSKCVKGEDKILGALAAGITPRAQVDKALISIAPKKEQRRKIQAPKPTIECDKDL
ncbi:reverse transcriptase [Phytophthora megakarya]|uniref:Reverse transcriptase n=1 Tax=Phytophthora megakarya TaxID=4795 RepID=A0A225V5H9_9STRA|nr:reverse transcriptase [Phytophthora megakarya]